MDEASHWFSCSAGVLEMFECITMVSQITENYTELVGEVLLLNVHTQKCFGTSDGMEGQLCQVSYKVNKKQ